VLPSRLFAALADLAPARGEQVYDVAKSGQPFAWLADPDRLPRTKTVERLAALDALHKEERVLRRGWAWVLGSAEIEGVRRKVRLPLLVQPVRIERGLRSRIVPAGDLELTPLVADRSVAAALEAAPGLGSPGWLTTAGTTAWITAAAQAAGLPIARLIERTDRAPAEELVGCAAAALFIVRDVTSAGLRDTLLTWSTRPGLEETALTHVYGSMTATPARPELVRSPLPLNDTQREVVCRARQEPVIVVSGPPGNGKSHAVVAAALDTVDRGGSVLVATQSGYAAEVLGALLARYPGPVPILFGDAERRDAIATELSEGAAAGTEAAQLRRDADAVAAASATVDGLVSGIDAALTLERQAAELVTWEPLLAGLRVDLPRDFDPDEAEQLLAIAEPSAAQEGWWKRRRRRRVLRRLHRLTGAADGVPLDRIRAGIAAARAAAAAARLAANGGTDLGPAWAGLVEADAALAEAVGVAMKHGATSAKRWTGDARRSAAALAAALRAGRNRRREALAALDGAALVKALPLWVGTVTDVEDLLPAVPGLFDLVILDEAAHIDQIRAAPVLARAKRAMVVGDPRQLRFVSFVADVDVAATLAAHGLDEAADRLDVRRSSAFDVAVGAAAVTYLDEHYRSVPHLIEFSAKRFYGDRIELVTRHPRNERADVIDIKRIRDASVVDGVNKAEVDAVLEAVRKAKSRDIAVVTPFRKQADAIEAAVLASFSLDAIDRLGLRVGTVHTFQGSEAHTVVASLGLVDDDSPARRRFVADANLFNVLVTRARNRMIVVTSISHDKSVVGDYLAYSEAPPPLDTQPAADGWTARLAGELANNGRAVRPNYPVGRWIVDLCVEETGLICRPHPDGPQAHIERQRTLLRAGWTLRDAFASRWADNATRAALELAPELSAE
jgi:superfamily I DNA/RNA helicase